MTTQIEAPVQIQPERRLFTVDEYYAMAKVGILAREERVELIDGEIIVMAPIGDDHLASVDIGTRFLVRAVGDRAIVRVQGSIRLDERTQPQPDFALLKDRDDFYRSGAPGPDDVLLLIEVSYSSLSYDRNIKQRLYARFGIVESWIVNLRDGTIEVYTDPVGGEYTTTRVFRSGETVSPATFPDIALSVSDIIGYMLDDVD